MKEKIIRFFAERHLLANLITATVIMSGFFLWNMIQKEELPNMDLNFVRVSVIYPGATPGEVEYFVTRPIEDALRAVDGIYRITSTSGSGNCTIMIELDEKMGLLSEIVTEIQNAVLSVSLPSEVRDTPSVRQFKTSRKAIIDIGLYVKNKTILDDPARKLLQETMYSVENRLLRHPEINSMTRSGYLKRELRIDVNPGSISNKNISLDEVITAVRDSHVRRPAGDLQNIQGERVVIRSELDTPEKLRSTVIRGTFEGNLITLGKVAQVNDTFALAQEITKINGHEGILLRAVKSSSTGIIDAVEKVKHETNLIKNELAGTGIEIVLLDDESREVRNRLSIIGWNGAIGFILIFLTLIAFLNFRSAFWVALGIPFSLSFTLLFIFLFGMTINNITLAGIIIVLGMVVDDAIVVAENIVRQKREGETPLLASINGASYVMLPVITSVLTTCMAFLPMLGIEGRIGMMNAPIPLVISLMLAGSLVESFITLPAHLNMHLPAWWYSLKERITTLPGFKKSKSPQPAGEEKHWFDSVEKYYEILITKALRHRKKVLLLFCAIPAGAAIIFSTSMNFVMFPDEEVSELIIQAETPKNTRKYETARIAESFEKILDRYIGTEIVGHRAYIARGRFGSAAQENNILWIVELIPRDKRSKSQALLEQEWKGELKKIETLSKVRIRARRFGQQSGSPVAILVQDNNDQRREKTADNLAKELEKNSNLRNIEIDRPMLVEEHRLSINRERAAMLGINPTKAGSILRAVVEGSIVYELVDDDSKIDVRVTIPNTYKQHINDILSMPVANQGSYLVPLRNLVTVTSIPSPGSINRQNFMRTTVVYADMNPDTDETPLTVAAVIENEIFPELIKENPRVLFSFDGEIKETRESSGNLQKAVIIVILLIYIIMAVLFNSATKPFIIMLSIPFGAAGAILALKLHGISHFGFFSAIGIIGLAGVAVNAAIVMTVKMIDVSNEASQLTPELIGNAAGTRLRAVVMTTISTFAALIPTAYGVAGYDSILSEMMLAIAWGLLISSLVTLFVVPILFSYISGMSTKGSRI